MCSSTITNYTKLKHILIKKYSNTFENATNIQEAGLKLFQFEFRQPFETFSLI